MSDSNRRDFLKTGSLAASVALAASATGVHAQGPDEIKVGLIGCGGRGSGAIRDSLKADKSIRVHAVGDVFLDKAERQAKSLTTEFKNRTNLTGRAFGGVDAFKEVIDSGVDLVILATPPGFRPAHLQYAVEKGKHIFCEKPVAVDGPGIRKVMELVEISKKKNLAIVAGTQRRHQKAYLEVYKRIQNGDIGDIVGGRCAWNNEGIWFNKRKEGESDIEYQMRNWYHFLWVCGDHIVEQHIHNLDVINWFTGQHPVRCTGMGGRMGGTNARPNGDANEVGHIFDHFAVEYEYAKGVKISSYCRHYPGPGDVSEMVIGTKGTIKTASGGFYTLNGEEIYSPEQDGKDTSPYVLEHVDLIASIKNGKHLNELQQVAESTLTAIMGRMSTYTGVALKWEQAMASKEDTFPKDFTLKGKNPIGPVPQPGKTKFF
jgi:myo-inositol 2-dehydrogenase / D-chiro-inositol 1-dehydrogenase